MYFPLKVGKGLSREGYRSIHAESFGAFYEVVLSRKETSDCEILKRLLFLFFEILLRIPKSFCCPKD